jgi:hypothetical protein
MDKRLGHGDFTTCSTLKSLSWGSKDAEFRMLIFKLLEKLSKISPKKSCKPKTY